MADHPDFTLIAYRLVLADLTNDDDYYCAVSDLVKPEHTKELILTLVRLLGSEIYVHAAARLAGLGDAIDEALGHYDDDDIGAQAVADVTGGDLATRVIAEAEKEFRSDGQ